MGSLMVTTAALLVPFLLPLLSEVSSVLGQDPRETDALCKANGCFMVYFQRKTFLDAWRACKEKGGNLATIKHGRDAAAVAELFSSLDLRYSRTKVQVWIGLQRQPRQCSTTHLLRGFSWTTGDQNTEYTNWQKEDSLSTCSVPRCVAVGYSAQDSSDNLKWLDGPCSDPVDGYLCHYAYKGMCPALWSEGAGNARYTTPFNLQSTLLTHVPLGTVATLSCPTGTQEQRSVVCTLKDGASVGWSNDSPLCPAPAVSHNWCDRSNGGCEHLCRTDGVHFYCECHTGFQLGNDGQSCALLEVCRGAPCEFECLQLSDGYRCACPDGYMLAPDEYGCLDVDECLQSPCEQLCVNAPGTFVCQCLEGYQPDDHGDCEDVDECMVNPCENDCENTPGSYICHCHLGFSPVPEDPSRCQDIDECQIPGTCEQMCVNYNGGFECDCRIGYKLMSDHYSCRERDAGNDQSAATVHPGALWDSVDYDWYAQQSRTDWPPEEDRSVDWPPEEDRSVDWPPEEDRSVDWPTDPPRFVDPDDFWIFSASQDRPTQEAPHDEEDIDTGGTDWQISPTELEALRNVIATTTSSSTTSDLYEGKEETTTDLPLLSTSTISGGAWNWKWSELTKKKQSKPVTGLDMSTGASNHTEREENAVKDVGEEKTNYPGSTQPQTTAIPTQLTPSPSAPSEAVESGDIVDSEQGDRGHKPTTTWLLVGLLVPICFIIVVMAALGIVYCTRCAVQPRTKDATDCYHWISGAHDKPGASNSAGSKAHV